MRHPQKNRALRVLHCPLLVGCNAPTLAIGERALGIDSRAYALQVNAAFDATFAGDAIVLSALQDSLLKREWKRWRLLWKACTWADVVHFNFGTSIFPWEWVDITTRTGWAARVFGWYAKLLGRWDIRLLKLLGRNIFVTYQGDDARQGEYCRKHFAINFATEVDAEYYNERREAAKRRNVAVFDRYADGIYSLNPDLLHVLPARAKFLPYATVDLEDWTYVSPRPDGPIRIGHAPTHRAVKGTRHVIAAVERLQREGLDIEFVMIESVPRGQAREVYASLDILVDQVLAGWYGGLAVECMALGRPVVAYLREDDLGFILPGMAEEMAVVSASPDTLYEVLHSLVTSGRENLRLAGVRSRRYVEKFHDLKFLAGRLSQDYLAAFNSENGDIRGVRP